MRFEDAVVHEAVELHCEGGRFFGQLREEPSGERVERGGFRRGGFELVLQRFNRALARSDDAFERVARFGDLLIARRMMRRETVCAFALGVGGLA